MSFVRRARRSALLAALALAAPACGDLAVGNGASPEIDASTSSDAGVDSDTGASPPPADEPMGYPADPSNDGDGASYEDVEPSAGLGGAGRADPAACYDGLDNDGDDSADCDDPACWTLRSCCVGSGSCCGAPTGPTLPAVIDPAGCVDGLEACLAAAGLDAALFGDPFPFLDGDAIAPGGDGDFDSGLVLEPRVDLTAHRVEVDATFLAAEACTEACVEGAGVGFSAQATFDTRTHVQVVAGLLLSGSRREVSLVLGDATVARFPLAADEATYGLVLEPTGEVRVVDRASGAELARAPFAPARDARLVLYGHSRNPDAVSVPGARIARLATRTELCNVPDAWSVREPIALREGSAGLALPAAAYDPSLAEDGAGRAVLVFEQGGALFLARRPGTVASEFTTTQALADPALSATHPFEAGALHQPELLPLGDGLVLFYAAGPEGARVIGRATAAAGETHFTSASAPVLTPADLVDGGDATSFDDPTVVVHPSGAWLMVVRALTSRGPELWVYESWNQGVTFDRVAGLELRAAVRDALGDEPVDEIGAPSLAIHAGAYHLHFGLRRGTRWSTALAVSDELVRFRVPTGGLPALGPSGDGADRLGAAQADVLPVGDALEAVYVGLDGARSTLAFARREASATGTFE